MKTKIVKEKEQKTVLSRRNYIILISGSILIIAGYILMSGERSTLAASVCYCIIKMSELRQIVFIQDIISHKTP